GQHVLPAPAMLYAQSAWRWCDASRSGVEPAAARAPAHRAWRGAPVPRAAAATSRLALRHPALCRCHEATRGFEWQLPMRVPPLAVSQDTLDVAQTEASSRGADRVAVPQSRMLRDFAL